MWSTWAGSCKPGKATLKLEVARYPEFVYLKSKLLLSHANVSKDQPGFGWLALSTLLWRYYSIRLPVHWNIQYQSCTMQVCTKLYSISSHPPFVLFLEEYCRTLEDHHLEFQGTCTTYSYIIYLGSMRGRYFVRSLIKYIKNNVTLKMNFEYCFEKTVSPTSCY